MSGPRQPGQAIRADLAVKAKSLSGGSLAGHHLTITFLLGPAIHAWVPVTLAHEPGDSGKPVREAEQKLPEVMDRAALCQPFPSSEPEWT